MKTVAIIESCDTKYKEAKYIKDFLKSEGIDSIVINTSTGPGESYNYDVSREEVCKAHGTLWKDLVSKSRGEKIDFMKEAVAAYTKNLYEEGKIQGAISVGGLQNAVMASGAMQTMPVGIPKVIATTVACGNRKFDIIAGDKDIVMIPGICDMAGINVITDVVIKNACACLVGMLNLAGELIKKSERPVVALTMMGATNDGAVGAIEAFDEAGIEAIGFHATGIGGATMESIIADDVLDGVLDLTLHEISSEFLGGGFSYSERAKLRLTKSIEKKMPLVVSLGGLDFVDFYSYEFPHSMDKRKHIYHNSNLAHIKLLPDEAVSVGEIVAERLNEAKHPIKLLIPTKGLRHDSDEGQGLHAPELDEILKETIVSKVNDNVEIVYIDHGLATKEFGKIAASHLIAQMIAEGKLSTEYKKYAV